MEIDTNIMNYYFKPIILQAVYHYETRGAPLNLRAVEDTPSHSSFDAISKRKDKAQ